MLMRLEPQLRDMGIHTVDDLLHLEDHEELQLKRLEIVRYTQWKKDWLEDHSSKSSPNRKIAGRSSNSSSGSSGSNGSSGSSCGGSGATKDSDTDIDTTVDEMIALLKEFVVEHHSMERRDFIDMLANSFDVSRPKAFEVAELMGFSDDFMA